jgi:hypothetical protein
MQHRHGSGFNPTPHPRPEDHIGFVIMQSLDQSPSLAEVIRQISVRVDDVVTARHRESRPKCGPVSALGNLDDAGSSGTRQVDRPIR